MQKTSSFVKRNHFLSNNVEMIWHFRASNDKFTQKEKDCPSKPPVLMERTISESRKTMIKTGNNDPGPDTLEKYHS